MSKKWVALLLAACIALAGGVIYVRMNTDTKGPEIVFSDNTTTLYRPDMSTEELLAGVTATDDTDGDVTDSLTVESVYDLDDTHVVVTYTAKDRSNNITKQRHKMELDPSAASKYSEDSSEFGEKTDTAATTSFDTNQTENSADSEETTDTSADTARESDTDSSVAETTQTPTPEVDEAAAEKEKQTAEADAMPAQNPRIYLSDYLVRVPVGTSIDLLSYVSEIKDDSDDVYALWRKVQITGKVNSAVPGTYKCTYYVIDSQNNISNNAVLTVVVE